MASPAKPVTCPSCHAHALERQGDLSVFPSCGDPDCAEHNQTVPPDDPRPGDFTVCYHCAQVLRFADKNTLRIAESSDMLELGVGGVLKVGLLVTMVKRELERQKGNN